MGKKAVDRLVVGDRVTSQFDREFQDIIRTITKIEDSTQTSSGRRIWADGGAPCACCGRPFAQGIEGVDGAWFEKE